MRYSNMLHRKLLVKIKELESERDEWRYDAQRLADAIRVTREFVGEELLPAQDAWDWYDTTRAHEALVAKYHRV